MGWGHLMAWDGDTLTPSDPHMDGTSTRRQAGRHVGRQAQAGRQACIHPSSFSFPFPTHRADAPGHISSPIAEVTCHVLAVMWRAHAGSCAWLTYDAI